MVAGLRGSEVAGLPTANPVQPEPRNLATRKWRLLYSLVLLELGATIAILYFFTHVFQ